MATEEIPQTRVTASAGHRGAARTGPWSDEVEMIKEGRWAVGVGGLEGSRGRSVRRRWLLKVAEAVAGEGTSMTSGVTARAKGEGGRWVALLCWDGAVEVEILEKRMGGGGGLACVFG